MLDCSLSEHAQSLGTPISIVNRSALWSLRHAFRMKTLAERAIEAREATGLSQAEAARLIGISQPSLWEIENGKSMSLKGPTLVKMAEVYGVNERWLQSNIGKMELDQSSVRAQAQQIARDWESLPVFVRHYLQVAIRDVVEYTSEMTQFARESLYGDVPEDGEKYSRVVQELEDGVANLRFQRTALSTDDGRRMIRTYTYHGPDRRGSLFPPKRRSPGM